MEQLLNESQNLYFERQQYLKDRKILLDKRKSDRDQYEFTHLSETGFTQEELFDLGHNLDEIYRSIPEYVRKDDHKDSIGGVPGLLLDYIGNFGVFSKYEKDQDQDQKKKKKEKEKKDPGENYKNTYYHCLEKINELNATVLKIDIRPLKYQDGNSSSCIGDHAGFIFKCQKGNFMFEIRFYDDCDCVPGILALDGIVCLPTGISISSYCDLYCQNTSKYRMNTYLNLLKSTDLEDFFEKQYGKYYHLAKLLNANIYHNKDTIHVNDMNKLDFYLKVRSLNESIMLIPYNDMLYLSRLTYRGNGWTDNPNVEKKITSVHEFIRNTKDERFKIDYHGEEDFPSLEKLITAYLNYIGRRFGFLEGKRFCNRFDIEKSLNKRKDIYFEHLENLLTGKEIDTLVTVHKGTDWDAMYDDKIYPESHYPRERYKIHFEYYQGDEEVKVTVEGQYIYVDEISKVYYENGLENYKPPIHEFCPKVILKGKLSELLKEVSKLL